MPLRIVIRSCVLVIVYALLPLAAFALAARGTYGVVLSLALVAIGLGFIIIGLWGTALFMPQRDPLLKRLKRACTKKTVALTFDDGPMEPWTSQVLDILKEEGIKATFFLLGERAERYPHLVRRIHEEGHAIGNHTTSHPRLVLKGGAKIHEEIDGCERTLGSLTGDRSRIFRAPHGFVSPKLKRILASRSMVHIPWTRGVWDTDCPPATTLVRRATRRPKKLEVILLHDGTDRGRGDYRDSTVEALPGIIDAYQQRGYAFTTIPKLLKESA